MVSGGQAQVHPPPFWVGGRIHFDPTKDFDPKAREPGKEKDQDMDNHSEEKALEKHQAEVVDGPGVCYPPGGVNYSFNRSW